MNRLVIAVAVFAVVLVLPACRGHGAKFSKEDLLAADSIELQLGERGEHGEIEYHISPNDVPAAVKAAMDKLHPGGPYTGAEKEWNDGKLYYELTRRVKGLEIEAMFTPDGMLHSEEIQVRESEVPPAVRTAAHEAVPGARIKKYEEIRNAERELYEYHVKMSKGKKHYKVIFGLDGMLRAIYREIPAEIEARAK